MEITHQQYEKISDCFPRQRGNVKIDNLAALNAMLYVLEHGCKWRGLPPSFGNWHSVYTRLSRWSKNGVLDRIFKRLQQEQMLTLRLDAVSLDSTVIKVHPDGTGALKKTARSQSENPAEDGRQNCI
jgi:transposase